MLKSWIREKGGRGSGGVSTELFIGPSADLASSSLFLQEHGNKRVTWNSAGLLTAGAWDISGCESSGKKKKKERKEVEEIVFLPIV